MEKKDIFDRLMELPCLNIFQKTYKKYKEVLLYLFFGGLTTFISILMFGGLVALFETDPLVANVISWIISVAFAFITNCIWVFDGLGKSKKAIWGQMIDFYVGRALTLLLEELILFVFVKQLECNSMMIKIVAQAVVIVLNYVISKLWIFRR